MIFEEIGSLFVNVAALSDWRYWVMWLIGGLLIYLANRQGYGANAAVASGLWHHSGQYTAFRLPLTR